MKRILFLPLFLLSIHISAQVADKAEKITLKNSELNNLYRVAQGVYRSEQPTTKDFCALRAFGIKEVLNLRRLHSDDDEAKGISLTLHRLKTNAHSIDEEELIQALKIIQNRKGPILIHCRHGSDRTGAVIAMYRIVFEGVSKENAIKEMTDGGFGFHKIYGNIIKTIRKADVKKIRQELDLK